MFRELFDIAGLTGGCIKSTHQGTVGGQKRTRFVVVA